MNKIKQLLAEAGFFFGMFILIGFTTYYEDGYHPLLKHPVAFILIGGLMSFVGAYGMNRIVKKDK